MNYDYLIYILVGVISILNIILFIKKPKPIERFKPTLSYDEVMYIVNDVFAKHVETVFKNTNKTLFPSDCLMMVKLIVNDVNDNLSDMVKDNLAFYTNKDYLVKYLTRNAHSLVSQFIIKKGE